MPRLAGRTAAAAPEIMAASAMTRPMLVALERNVVPLRAGAGDRAADASAAPAPDALRGLALAEVGGPPGQLFEGVAVAGARGAASKVATATAMTCPSDTGTSRAVDRLAQS